MSASGIIRPYFFENEAGNAVTVNADRYVEMLQNFTQKLARFPVNENMLFQQDGATSHTARMSMNTVNALFPNQVVSRNVVVKRLSNVFKIGVRVISREY